MDSAFIERLEKVKVEVAQQCVSDPEFREQFIANPSRALEEEYGLEEGQLGSVNFSVVEEKEGDFTFVLPPASKEGELTEEELEMVAGGFGFIGFAGAVKVATLVIGGVKAGASVAGVVQNTRAGRRW